MHLEHAIDLAEAETLHVIAIHSHPEGPFEFSRADDESDHCVVASLFQAVAAEHGSAIMTSDGAVRARLYKADLSVRDMDLVTVAGDELQYWWAQDATSAGAGKRPIAFTASMTKELGRLSAALIGASGTGSVVCEQLARLGFGHITLIDSDRVEQKNLNRIINATRDDAAAGRFKVDVLAAATASHRGCDVVKTIAASVATRQAVLEVAQCDVVFCCVDSLEARQIADSIAAAFLLPLFDVGVSIPVRKSSDSFAVADVCGRVDYVQPGGSTLQDRGVYTPEKLRGEYLRKVAPAAHRQELDAGYLRGLAEEAPAVITLNMRAGAACVNEFIARAYPFRLDANHLYARTEFSLAACEEEHRSEASYIAVPNAVLALGDREPLLGLPSLNPHGGK